MSSAIVSSIDLARLNLLENYVKVYNFSWVSSGHRLSHEIVNAIIIMMSWKIRYLSYSRTQIF